MNDIFALAVHTEETKGQKCIQVSHITFNNALEELREDAIGSQLMEHTTEELLGHTCSISRDHHAEMKGKEKKKKNCTADETLVTADYMEKIKMMLFFLIMEVFSYE